MTKIKDSVEDLGLTNLYLGITDISEVAPDVVAGALTKLEEVIDVSLTPDQVQAIFTRLQFGGSKLKCLTLPSPPLICHR